MIARCPHGNYVPKGDTHSPGCTGCHPPSIHVRVFKPTQRVTKFVDERTVDTIEYTERSAYERLADASAMEMALCR